MGNPRLRDPLRRPAFRRLAISYAINEMGDWLGLVALSVLVFELHRQRPGDRRCSSSAPASCRRCSTPFFVARLERPPPRFVLPAIYAGEAAAFLALALLADHFSLAAVVAIAAIDGALALTAKTLTRAVTAAMLEPEGELRAGNAILNVAFTGGRRGRPGGRRAASSPAFGVQSALLLDAVSFYVIAWILFTARPLPQAEPEPGRLREQVRAGLAYIRDHVTLQRLIGAAGRRPRLLLGRGPDRGRLREGDPRRRATPATACCSASWGVGMVLGSVVFATLRRAPLPLLLFFSTIAIGGRLPGHGRGARPSPSPAPPPRSAAPATASSGWRWSARCRS